MPQSRGEWSTIQRLSMEWKASTIVLQWTRLIFIYCNHFGVAVSEELAKIMNKKKVEKEMGARLASLAENTRHI